MTRFTHGTAPTQYAEGGGTRFAYRRFGIPGRPPLVFYQHFMGTLDDHDPALSDAFATDREVILFDNTGVASSTGTVPDTIEAMARDAITFTNALGLTTIDIVALLSQTDQRLRQVLSLYRVLPANGSVAPGIHPRPFVPPREVSGKPRKEITGPRAILPGALGQFEVVTVNHSRPVLSIMGGSRLLPRVSVPYLQSLARSHTAVTLTGQDGTTQVRLMAVSFPGYGLVYAATNLSSLQQTLGQLELILIIGSAAAGAIAAGGVAWVMRRGLRPVEMMAGQADKINAGDLTDRVSPHDPRTEIGRLGAALNGMLARIQDFVAEREASQEATRRFFADASHELRTPLASLRANAELYQQGALPRRDQVDEAMRRITLEAQRMGALVDDMLRLARLDQHPGQQSELVSLSTLAAECVQRARTASPQWIWRADIADSLEVPGDEELLRRAIDNVLANVAAHPRGQHRHPHRDRRREAGGCGDQRRRPRCPAGPASPHLRPLLPGRGSVRPARFRPGAGHRGGDRRSARRPRSRRARRAARADDYSHPAHGQPACLPGSG